MSALIKEIELQKGYLNQKIVETIYFGGGTPSVLTVDELKLILSQIQKYYQFDDKAEITLEANPDDLNFDYLKELNNIGFNRLSIGTQSFNNKILNYLNRRHDAQQAIESARNAKKAGFKNISIDLIYGIPGMSSNDWKDNIEKAIDLNVEHISAYHLTIEPETTFGKLRKIGKLKEIEEEKSWEQFNLLIDMLEDAGFEHYEISNFARNKKYSKHNSSYWKQIEYLGLGPSAHSYNLNSRQWNISNVKTYIDTINKGKIPFSIEELSSEDKYNDYILTGLRTIWGIDLKEIKMKFGNQFYKYCHDVIKKMGNDLIIFDIEMAKLTRKGLFQSDHIISEFLIDN